MGNKGDRIDNMQNGYQVHKRMFVFGAGASSFCLLGENKNALEKSLLRPPLGYEIFDDRFEDIFQNYEGAKLSIPLFLTKEKDIELCLEDEWRKLRKTYNPSITTRHINLQFYLRDLFRRVSDEVVGKYYRNNLYSLFANKLQTYLASVPEERIALVSFNYDTILDQFIEKIFHSPFRQMSDYIDRNNRPVFLFKPHGSCNWGWRVNNKQHLNVPNRNLCDSLYTKHTELHEIYYKVLGSMDEMVHTQAWGPEKNNDKHFRGKYTVNKNRIEVIDNNLGTEYFPALLMPYRDKDEFVMHYDHQHTFDRFAGDMEELYLIGWKGNEDLFNRKLQHHHTHLKKIVIVNPMEKKEKVVSKNLVKNFKDLNSGRYTIEVIDTFEKFVVEEMAKIFTPEFADED